MARYAPALLVLLCAGPARADGVVPAALVDGLRPAKPAPPLLKRAETCAPATSARRGEVPEACRRIEPQILGYKRRKGIGRLAFLTQPEALSCEDCNTFEAWILRVETGNYDRHLTVAKGRACGKALRPRLRPFVRRVWRFVDGIRGRGYTPLRSVLAERYVDPAHVRTRVPLVRLGGPLKGRMLYLTPAGRKRKRHVALYLVSADNRRRVELDRFARKKGKLDYFDAPLIREVRITPDGRHLVVALALHDGVHCGRIRHTTKVYSIPTADP